MRPAYNTKHTHAQQNVHIVNGCDMIHKIQYYYILWPKPLSFVRLRHWIRNIYMYLYIFCVYIYLCAGSCLPKIHTHTHKHNLLIIEWIKQKLVINWGFSLCVESQRWRRRTNGRRAQANTYDIKDENECLIAANMCRRTGKTGLGNRNFAKVQFQFVFYSMGWR